MFQHKVHTIFAWIFRCQYTVVCLHDMWQNTNADMCFLFPYTVKVYILERGFQLFSLMFPCNVSSYDYNLHVIGILPVNLPEQC